MHSFLSKVFGRKKEDKDTSPTTLRPGELLDGKFEAVSPNVSPSAAHFLELDGQTSGENTKDKDKDVAFSLFKAKSRPSPPEIRGKRPATLPHLSLDFSAFNGDSNTNHSLTLEQTILSDAIIGRRRLNPMEALVLIRACSQSIVSKGLETLGIMHPHWYSASPEVQRRLISQFIHSMEPQTPPTAFSPNSAVASPFESEVELTHSPHDTAAVLRWGLRHFRLDGDSFGTDDGWYKAFLDAEAAAEYPPKAFTEKLAPLLPPAHLDVLVATLEVFSYLAAHSEVNGTSGSKLSKIFGLWLLSARQVEDKDDWQSFYARWERTGRMLEHLFLARIRDEFTDQRMPVRLLELVRRYPYTQGLSSPATDLQLLPRPHLTTQYFDALFVRIDVELPPERRKPTSKSPSDILADAFSTKVEEGEYAELWGKITAASKDGGSPSSLSNIFADETIRFLSLIPDKNSAKAVEPKSPTFSLLPISPSSPRGRSFSAAEPDKPAPVQHPKSATEPPPASAVSALSIGSDWAQFSSSGFLDTNPTIAPLVSTLFDTDVEKTVPPAAALSRKSSKRRAPSRKSVDLSAEPVIKPIPEVEAEVVKEEPKPVVRATNLQVIQIDEAFVDFWSDSLLDPITAAWPTFIICKFKSTLVPQLQYTAREDGIQKTLKWLILEQVITVKPAPAPVLPSSPSTSIAETARPVSPALSASGRTRFSFWSMSRTASTSSRSSQKGKTKEKVLGIGEMGELLEEEGTDQVKSPPSKVLTFSKSRKSPTEKSKDPTRKSVDVHAAKDVAPTSPVVAPIPAAEKAVVVENADSKDTPGVSVAVGAAATAGAVAITAAVAAAVESQPPASEAAKEEPNVDKDVQTPDVQEVKIESDVVAAEAAPAEAIEAPATQTSVEPVSVEAKEETEAAQINEVSDAPADSQVSAAETVEAPVIESSSEPAPEIAAVEAKEETEPIQTSDVSPTPVDTQVAPVESVDAPAIETPAELPSEIVPVEAKEEETEAEVSATPVDAPVAPVEVVEASAQETSEVTVSETAAVVEAKQEIEAAQVPEVSAEPVVEQEGEAVVDTPIPTTEAPATEPSEPAFEVEQTDAAQVDVVPVAESLVEETAADTEVASDEAIEAPATDSSSAEPISETVPDVETKEEEEVTTVPEVVAVPVAEALEGETVVDVPVEAPATSVEAVSKIPPVVEGQAEVETAQAPEAEADPVAEPSGEEVISVSEDHPIVASDPENVEEKDIPATSSTELEVVEDIVGVAAVAAAALEISPRGEAEAVVEQANEGVLPEELVEEKSGGIAEEEIVSSVVPAAESLVQEEPQEVTVVEPAVVEIEKDLAIDAQPESEHATELEQDQPSDVVAPVDEQPTEEPTIVPEEAIVEPQVQENVVQEAETVLEDATPEEDVVESVEPSAPSTEIEPAIAEDYNVASEEQATEASEALPEPEVAPVDTAVHVEDVIQEPETVDHPVEIPDVLSREVTDALPETDASQTVVANESTGDSEEPVIHHPDATVKTEVVGSEPAVGLVAELAAPIVVASEILAPVEESKESVEEEKAEESKLEEAPLKDEPAIVNEVSHSNEGVPVVDEGQSGEISSVSETPVTPAAPIEEKLSVETAERDVPPVDISDAVEDTQHEDDEISDDPPAVEQPNLDDVADSRAVEQIPVKASSEPINIASSVPDVVPIAVPEDLGAEASIDIPPVPLVEVPTELVEGTHVTVLVQDEVPEEIEPVNTTLDTEVSQTHVTPPALLLAGSTPGPQSSLNPTVVELDEGTNPRSLDESEVREDNIIIATNADEESANVVAADQVNVTDEDPVIHSVGSTSEQINLPEHDDDITDPSVAESRQSISGEANDDSALEGPPDETKLDDSHAEEIAVVAVAAVAEGVLATDQADVTVPASAAEEIKETEILDSKPEVAEIPSVGDGPQGDNMPDENVSSTIVQADTSIADGTLDDEKPVSVDHPDPIPVLENPIAVEDVSTEDSSAAPPAESLEEEKIENEEPLADQEGTTEESATENLQEENTPVLDQISDITATEIIASEKAITESAGSEPAVNEPTEPVETLLAEAEESVPLQETLAPSEQSVPPQESTDISVDQIPVETEVSEVGESKEIAQFGDETTTPSQEPSTDKLDDAIEGPTTATPEDASESAPSAEAAVTEAPPAEAQGEEIPEPAVTEDKPTSSEILEPVEERPTTEGSDAGAKVEEESQVIAADDAAQPEPSNHPDGETIEATTLVSSEEPTTQELPTVGKPNDDVTAPEQDESTNGPATEPEETLPEVSTQDSSGEGFASVSVEETNTIDDSAQPTDVSLDGENNGSVEETTPVADVNPLEETSEEQRDSSEAPVVHEAVVDSIPAVNEQATGEAVEQSTVETSAIEDSVPSSGEPLIGQVEDVQEEQADDVPSAADSEVPPPQPVVDASPVELVDKQPLSSEAQDSEAVLPEQLIVTTEVPPLEETSASSQTLADAHAEPDVTESNDILIPAVAAAVFLQNESSTEIEEPAQSLHSEVLPTDEPGVSRELEQTTIEESPLESSAPVADEPSNEPSDVAESAIIDGEPTTQETSVEESADSAEETVAALESTELDVAEAPISVEEPQLEDMSKGVDAEPEQLQDDDAPPAAEPEVSVETPSSDVSPAENVVAETIEDQPSLPDAEPSTEPTEPIDSQEDAIVEQPILVDDSSAQLPVQEQSSILEETTAISAVPTPETTTLEEPVADEPTPIAAEAVDSQEPLAELAKDVSFEETTLEQPEPTPQEPNEVSEETKAVDEVDTAEDPDVPVEHPEPISETTDVADDKVVEEDGAIDETVAPDVVVPVDEESATGPEPTPEEPIQVEDKAGAVSEAPAATDTTFDAEGQDVAAEKPADEEPDSAQDETLEEVVPQEVEAVEVAVAGDETIPVEGTKEDSIPVDDEVIEKEAEVVDEPAAVEEPGSAEEPINATAEEANAVNAAPEEQVTVVEATTSEESEPTQISAPADDEVISKEVGPADDIVVEDAPDVPVESTTVEEPQPTPEPALVDDVPEETPAIDTVVSDDNHIEDATIDEAAVPEPPSEAPESTPEDSIPVSDEVVLKEEETADQAVTAEDALPEHTPTVEEPVSAPEDVEEVPEVVADVSEKPEAVEEEAIEEAVPASAEPIEESEPTPESVPVNDEVVHQDAVDEAVAVENKDIPVEETTVEEPETISQAVIPDDEVAPEEAKATESAQEGTEEPISVGDEVVLKEETADQAVAAEDDLPEHTPTDEEPASAPEDVENVSEDPQVVEDVVPVSDDHELPIEPQSIEESEPTTESVPVDNEAVPQDAVEETVVVENKDVPVEEATVEEPEAITEEMIPVGAVAAEEVEATETAQEDTDVPVESAIAEVPEPTPDESKPVDADVVEDETAEETVAAEVQDVEPQLSTEEPESTQEPAPVEVVPEEPTAIDAPVAVEVQDVPVEETAVEVPEPTTDANAVDDAAIVEEGEVAHETVDQDAAVEETKIEEPEATSAESTPADAVAEEAAPEEINEVDAVVPEASHSEEIITEAAEPSQEQSTPVDDEVVLEPEAPEATEAAQAQDADTPTEKTPLEQPEPVQESIIVDDEAIHEEAEAVDSTLSVEELDEMLPSPSTDLSTIDPDVSFATSGPFAPESVMSSIGEELGDDDDVEDDDPVLDVDSKVSEAEDDILNGTASGNGHLAESEVGLSEPVAEPSDVDVEKAPEESDVVEDATNGDVVDGPSITEDSPPDSEPDKENGVHVDKSVPSTLGPDEEIEPSVVEIAGSKVAEAAADEVEA